MLKKMLYSLFRCFLLGRHYWATFPGDAIVGFEVTEKEWKGQPTRSGWDVPKGPEQVVDRFLYIEDAKRLEEKLRKAARPNFSYNIRPIQVKAPFSKSREQSGEIRLVQLGQRNVTWEEYQRIVHETANRVKEQMDALMCSCPFSVLPVPMQKPGLLQRIFSRVGLA